MELAVDDDVLHAALAFVDSFSEPVKSKRLASHARLKRELAALRAETVVLEDQIGRQRSAQSRASKPTEAVAWRAVALCQQERRRRAELENARLRARVQEQIRLARRLVKMIESGWKDQKARGLLPQKVPRPLPPCGRSSLVQTARGMCLQSPAIFALPYFLCGATMGTSTVRRMATPMGPTVELFDSRVMPFNYKQTSGAIWDHLTHHTIPHVVQQKETGSKGNYQLEREIEARLTLPTSGLPVLVDGVVAGHRVENSSSFLVAWAVEIQTQVNEASASGHFAATERVWMLAQPLTSNQAYSLIQTYMVSSPSTPERGDRNSLLVEAHLGSVEHHMEEMWGHIESMLLDEQRASPPHSKVE